MSFIFEKLNVYQEAINVAEKISELTEEFPRGSYYLSDQLNRAATSIALNIAEGNGRYHKNDRNNFFYIARGSVHECVPLILSIAFICFLGYSSVFAKPMPAPTKGEAFKSSLIVIVEYTGYKSEGKIDYFGGPIAQYKLVRVLKGINAPKVFDVRYDFTDGSACIAEVGWKFTENLMPQKGSKWILFLNKDTQTKHLTTYRGPFGRWEANSGNITEVENVLKREKVDY